MNVFEVCKSVVIIGNGFDLNCGLKTRYKDVYKQYKNTPSTNSTIAGFKNDIDYESDNWSDFELGMSEYAKKFDSEDDFIECLDDFSSYMHQYLKNIQHSFFENWNIIQSHKSTINSFSNSINNLGKGISHNIDFVLDSNSAHIISSIGFISLNYTSVFDTILKYAFDGYIYKKPIHVHGLLGDDLILGMDRDEQLKIKFDITNRLRRHFIKPFFNFEYDTQRIDMANNMIDQSKYVFVYGASLGESDLSWREKLLSWLCSSDENHLFIYKFKSETQSFPSVQTKKDFEEQQKKMLVSDWNISLNDEQMNRLHLPCGIKLFDIETAIKEDAIRNSKHV